jgi:hypothetical protein
MVNEHCHLGCFGIKGINSDSMVTQLWGPITLGNPDNGGDMSPETSVLTRGTWYKVPGDIYN